jgi:ubiquitin-activating enzyme E1
VYLPYLWSLIAQLITKRKDMKDLLCFWSFLLPFAFLSTASSNRWGLSRNKLQLFKSVGLLHKQLGALERIRGGSTTSTTANDGKNDEERYSRQVYTLGARAHGLVRSSTVYVDGPDQSGLVYECVKNLALSGVGHIVIVTSEDDIDSNYHNKQFDDLGRTYTRAARAELGLDDDEEEDSTLDTKVLAEFLRRLNPSLTVTSLSRSELVEGAEPRGILLCVDRPFETQARLNQLSRNLGFSFVSVETAGVYGFTFCDFGHSFEIHDVDGETPLIVPLDHVEMVEEEENTLLVHCVDGERHDVSKGDKIQFQIASGDMLPTLCSVTHVKSPQRFSVRMESDGTTSLKDFVAAVNSEAASLSRMKIPEHVSFLPLETALREAKENGALFTPCDLDKSFDETRRNAVFGCFQALSTFVRTQQRLPMGRDVESFLTIARKESWSDTNLSKNADWEHHCKQFTKCCTAKFTPLQSIFGAIAAQETLKAASGLYNPIRQFLLYDCDEVLETSGDSILPSDKDKSVFTGQAYILGQKVENKLKSKRLFVVGAGAIGCEILKNLSAMGAGTGKKGCVVVTDMDTIEQSNLSRQLLFRDSDIGKFKSVAAQEAIRRFNPSLKMEVHTSRVGDDAHGPFDDQFWSSKINIVLNALDNVEARLYMDSQCVANEKALVDAGTLGSKGNVQVVVPHQSESYGSSADPPELAIPVCTLKNFPYLISHTIQWSLSLFDGFFIRRTRQGNEYAELLSSMKTNDLVTKLVRDLGEEAALNAAEELGQDLAMSYEESDATLLREESVKWAATTATKLFRESVEALLRQHPPGSLDEDGEPFWSGSRKEPKPLSFLASKESDSRQALVNKNVIDFVRAAARLRIETFSQEAASSGASLISLEEAAAALTHAAASSDVCERDTSDQDTHSLVSNYLKQVAPGAKKQLNVAEFEKDDESNGHVDFVTAASNLRAMCYGIPPVDAMETRRVAGKIVPAMITTTAFVSALSCIELIKLIKGVPLKLHRNAFINLALPFFAYTSPLPAEEILGFRGQTYTLWDRITIEEGKKDSDGITLRRLLKRLKAKICDDPDSVDIATVSFGQFMIYANFLHDDELMDKKLWDLIEEAVASGNAFDNEFSSRSADKEDGAGIIDLDGATFLDLTVVVEDLESGEEDELPPIRVTKFKT